MTGGVGGMIVAPATPCREGGDNVEIRAAVTDAKGAPFPFTPASRTRSSRSRRRTTPRRDA
jgi:hypothetical protein